MGISYAAAKTTVPEAFEIGKDYYGLTDLFPACASTDMGLGLQLPIPKLTDLPYLVGSRHIVGSAAFCISDYYQNADEMIARAEEIKQRKLDTHEIQMFNALLSWAGNDSIQIIADFEYLEERGAQDEYQLCAAPSEYRFINVTNAT